MNKKSFFYSILCSLALLSPVQAKTSTLINQKAPEFSAKALFPDGSVKDFKLSDYAGASWRLPYFDWIEILKLIYLSI